MKRTLAIFALLLFACTTRTTNVQAPLPSPGTIQGLVLDLSGVPLPGVAVSIIGPTGVRTTVTDENGRYLFGGIAIGSYTIKAELPGFGSVERGAYVTGEGASHTLFLRAAASEAITVTAEAPLSTSGPAWTRSSPRPERRPRAVQLAVVPVIPMPTPMPGQGVTPSIDPQYAAFADHGFIDTAQERVTTFAIDVDRASYANVRRFLTSGLVPPRDAVRIEEMINYFTYSYPQPTGSVPFSITTEVSGCP